MKKIMTSGGSHGNAFNSLFQYVILFGELNILSFGVRLAIFW